MITKSAKYDVFVEAIAAACHEANRAYCATIGDDSQPSWDAAADWQRDSARDGVRKILSGEVMTPEQSHENWLAVKDADGWVYGEVKDVNAKTHPCMVAYADLPEDQKRKDDIFFATIRDCERALGLVEVEAVTADVEAATSPRS